MTGEERAFGRLEGKVDGLADEIDRFRDDTQRRFDTVHNRINDLASKRNQIILIASYVVVASVAVVNLWLNLSRTGPAVLAYGGF